MTINDWIISNFGTNVKINGMDAWGNRAMKRAYFPTDNDGSLFVYCGGQCVIAFEIFAINRQPVYLVIEPARYRNDGDSRDRLALHQAT